MTNIITTNTLTINKKLYLTNILKNNKIKNQQKLPITNIIKNNKITTLINFQKPISLKQIQLQSIKTFNN